MAEPKADALRKQDTPTSVDPIAQSQSILKLMYPDILGWKVSLKAPASPNSMDPIKPRSWLFRFLPNKRKPADAVTVKKIPKDDITLIVSDAENTTPREVKYEELVQRYDKKKQETQQIRIEHEEHFSYLIAKHTGKKAQESFAFKYDHELAEAPRIVEQNKNRAKTTSSISYDDAIKQYEQKNLSFKETIRNLTTAYSSQTRALEQYVDQETRLGQAAKHAFDKRQQKINRRTERIKALEQDPKTKSLVRRAKTTIDKVLLATSRPFSYTGAALKSAASIILYDYNPLRVLGEKTVGKLWTATRKHPSVSLGKFAEPFTKNANSSISKLATKFVEYARENSEKSFSFRGLAANLEKKLIVDPVTGRGVATGAISETQKREAFFGGLGLAFTMHIVPTVLSTLPLIRHFAIKPVEIWRLMRASKMVGTGVGSVQHFVETVKNTESPLERVKLVAGAIFSAPLFYLLEKYSPMFAGVNPVLMGDIGLMKLVGLSQKYSQEHGLEQTKHLRMMEAIETGITGAFATESAQTIMEKVSQTAEALEALNSDPQTTQILVDTLHNKNLYAILTNPKLINLATNPTLVLPILKHMSEKQDPTIDAFPEVVIEAQKIYDELPVNSERITLPTLLTNAITAYEQETGQKPTWQQVDGFTDWHYVQTQAPIVVDDVIQPVVESFAGYSDPNSAVWSSNARFLIDLLMETHHAHKFVTPELSKLIERELDTNYTTWYDITSSPVVAKNTASGEGTLENSSPFLTTLAERFNDPNSMIQMHRSETESVISPQELRTLADTQQWITETDVFIEKQVEIDKHPMAMDTLLVHFLKQNDGSINQALWDMSTYLEYKARFDPTVGNYADQSALEANTLWYAKHLEDNFSIGPQWNDMTGMPKELWAFRGEFQNKNKDLDVVNQIGLGYHIMSQLALLNYASPELIKLMVIGRQGQAFGNHGYTKVAAETTYTAQLDDVQKILKQYEVSGPVETQHSEITQTTNQFAAVIPLSQYEFDYSNSELSRHSTAPGSFEEVYTQFATIRTLNPDLTTAEIATIIDSVNDGQVVPIRMANMETESYLSRMIDPNTNLSYIVVSDNADPLPAAENKQTLTLSNAHTARELYFPLNMDYAIERWMEYASNLSTEDKTIMADVMLADRLATTETNLSRMQLFVEQFQSGTMTQITVDAIPDKQFEMPWGTITATTKPGVYHVMFDTTQAPLEVNANQLNQLNSLYDKIHDHFSFSIPEDAQMNIELLTKQYLLSTLDSVDTAFIRENDYKEKILTVMTDNKNYSILPDADSLVDIRNATNGVINPQAYSMQDGLAYVQETLGLPDFALPSEATMIQSADGKWFVVAPTTFYAVYVADFHASMWIYPAQSEQEAQFILELANHSALSDVARFAPDAETLDHIINNTPDSTYLDFPVDDMETASNPQDLMRNVFYGDTSVFQVYDGTRILPMNEMLASIDPNKEGGYRYIFYDPDGGSGAIAIDFIHTNGMWQMTNWSSFAANGQAAYYLFSAGEIPPNIVDMIIKQIKEAPPTPTEPEVPTPTPPTSAP